MAKGRGFAPWAHGRLTRRIEAPPPCQAAAGQVEHRHGEAESPPRRLVEAGRRRIETSDLENK
eukprot:6012376-Pyramimonas_sp.AAC.1